MENTCAPEKCKLHDLLGGDPNQCPNYVESWWEPQEGGKPILVQDCAPKRQIIMLQDIFNRLLALQQVNEQSRNEADKINKAFIGVIGTVVKQIGKIPYIQED